MFLPEYFLHLIVCCLYNSSYWGFTHQVIFSQRDHLHPLTTLRYWYVKASLKPEIAGGFKSHQTLYVCLGVPHMLLCFHIFLYYLLYKTTDEEFPFLFYQAQTCPSYECHLMDGPVFGLFYRHFLTSWLNWLKYQNLNNVF